MGLVYLDISGFRNLDSVKLAPLLSGFNLFYGSNGSGKTSLLEAIYYLNVGRSFRTHQNDRIIAYSANKLSIFAQIQREAIQTSTHIVGVQPNVAQLNSLQPHFLQSHFLMESVGLERHQDGKLQLRINQQSVFSIAELARCMPVQLIDSHSHQLLDAGPSVRRKYIDGGMFYFSVTFFSIWRQFDHVLKQRNAALRQGVSRKELSVWTEELIPLVEALHALRCDYIAQLTPLLIDMITKLLPFLDLTIRYYAGWDERYTYADNLKKTIDRDYQLGYTQLGTHRADLQIIINDIPAKDILSRGQQKLFVCAMMLARGMLLNQQRKRASLYLVDDLPSELDSHNRTNLMTLLSEQKTQIFITATEQTIFQGEWPGLDKRSLKMFHVEQGRINEVNTIGVISE